MNRIVLIGNGFDLAHGLKTSYADFIDWYWEQWRDKLISCHSPHAHDELCTLSLDLEETRDRKETWHSLLHSHMHSFQSMAGMKFYDYLKSYGVIIKIFTPLLEAIMHDVKHQNWVDIERIYYRLLCDSLKENSKVSPSELNTQLAVLTEKLTEYLKYVEGNNEIKGNLNDAIIRKLYSPINPNEIAICASQQKRDWIEQLKKADPDLLYYKLSDYEKQYKLLKYYIPDSIEKIKKDEKVIDQNFQLVSELFLPEQVMIVNFNYTHIADIYIQDNQYNHTFSINHIHGELDSPQSIIFGYGDELDKHYKELEELNDNEYLNNIKSIKYLEATNYRNLLNFIESAPFQIYIMGHSCGNSDRTLLNTLFEHENCISIKPFYYQKEEGSDNYTEIVQNISRNFKDKQALRDKVVPKDYCEPLPQASAN
jgi:hypothetical protein